ncbi:DAK2 domain-containing protein [Cellulomonas composti]|uniref:DhaL domain-containing protein n=1 Tax=Cellulomonas composti TaxID=266130 RepID=A0A511JAU1_9CELL|nr:DAK2 domain-containing protein [Cellulomonas composti]GEL95110.1 hypothetical protein CCO02nite_17680 [Cellulomonas composti]
MLDELVVREWAACAAAALDAARGRLDALNVIPVPDADTGSNALLTFVGGRDALAALPVGSGTRAALGALARGAMLAARGNSGVILSQYLGGLARLPTPVPGAPDVLDADDLAEALARAARAARTAVAQPQEGTVLTLADEIAEAAAVAGGARVGAAEVVRLAVAAGHAELDRISRTHPVLRAAHVPDAGACALLVVLDALAAAAGPAPDAPPGAIALDWLPERAASSGSSGEGGVSGAVSGGAFEVMLVVRAPDPDLAPGLRTVLDGVGDAVAVVAGDGWCHAHVHTDDPAAAIEACAVGAREQVVVRRLDLVGACVDGGGPAAGAWGLVVVTRSPGLAGWYATAGAVVLVACDGAPVRADHLRRAITDTAAADVLLLPGGVAADRDLEPVRDELAGLQVIGASDELAAVVATLAFAVESGSRGVQAATLALARLRRWSSADDEPEARGTALETSAAGLADLLEQWGTGAPEPAALTVVHDAGFTPEARAAIAAAAQGHGLDVTFVGPASGGPRVALGLD